MNRAGRVLLCAVVCVISLSMPDIAASECFLRMDQIRGESADQAHRDEINILGWSIAESLAVESRAAAGAVAGRVRMQEFRFSARTSKASPVLFRFGATGQRIQTATLSCRKPGTERQEDYLRIRLDDVIVSSFQAGLQPPSAAPAPSPQLAPTVAGDGYPVDQVGLTFGKIFVEYRPTGPDGRLQGAVTGGYDLKTMKAQ